MTAPGGGTTMRSCAGRVAQRRRPGLLLTRGLRSSIQTSSVDAGSSRTHLSYSARLDRNFSGSNRMALFSRTLSTGSHQLICCAGALYQTSRCHGKA